MMKFKVHTSLCFSGGNQLGGNTLVGHMLLMNQEPEVVTEKCGQVWAVLVSYDDPQRASEMDPNTALEPPQSPFQCSHS